MCQCGRQVLKNNHRNNEEKALKEKVQLAVKKLQDEKAKVDLPAMNAYHRRMVYHWLESESEVLATSDSKSARLKKITLQLK